MQFVIHCHNVVAFRFDSWFLLYYFYVNVRVTTFLENLEISGN